MPSTISKEQAQRFLLKKHGLLGPTPFVGKDGALAYVRQTGCMQYDPVDVCGKSHELAFLSRVKGFAMEMLRELLYEDRVLMDFWDKNMSLVLTEEWPYFEPVREAYRQDIRSREAIEAVAERVRAHLREHGHASSQELPLEGKADWYWSSTALSRAALEGLYFRGELVIHHKKGTVKSYALAEDCLPKELLHTPNPCQTPEDQQAWQALRRIGAVGMLWNRASDAWLGISGFTSRAREAAFARLQREESISPVQVEGIPVPLYLRREDEALLASCAKPFSGKKQVRFLAPLDCLMWDRKLIQALFGFSYKWEIYNPESQRRFSYYVLPVLYGQRFAGRVEPLCDRKGKTLIMKRFWAEKGFPLTDAFRAALEEQARRLAGFHKLPLIRWEEGFWHNEPKEVSFRKEA
ncbi:MAG: crosslink repair DNA glycosylase YcaQ family protein [Candidatus Limiplasma sp.]|nr:crosslink repair DNA glycosylase YcaQ family protein [Candidatus Limiplasma sp.]